MSRKVAVSALIAVFAFGTFGVGIASSDASDAHDKVWVCHSTASEFNPWVLIHVKRSGWTEGHEGSDAHPGHLAPDFLFDDNPDKKAHPHGPAGMLRCLKAAPPTDPPPT